jgi:homoserine kinase type II
MSTAELAEVLSHYDLGDLLRHEKDRRGTVNASYFIETVKDGERRKFFLRKYNRRTRKDEVLFEHSLIEHIARARTCPVARFHPTREGATFLLRPAAGGEEAIFAIFDFLPGEDRYTWVDPRLSPHELRRAGALLARFHQAAATLTPRGWRGEPKIADLMASIRSLWSEAPGNSKGQVFDAFLPKQFDLLEKALGETHRTLTEAAACGLPELFIHSDFHPGNLKFTGREITGLVDFDWSKKDVRAFDLGLSLWYFCVSWRGIADGRLRLKAVRQFLEAYQQEAGSRSGVPQLSADELRFLPHFIHAGNAYVIHWTLRDYFQKDVDPEEYLVYLKHCVAFTRWFERSSNRSRLRNLLRSLR